MKTTVRLGLMAAITAGLAACSSGSESEAPAAAQPAPVEAAPAFEAVTSTAILMRGPISSAAFDFWNAVSVIVDVEGVHENAPSSEAEWERVWSAGISLAEYANLLRVAPHDRGGADWERRVDEFVEIGIEAARIAEREDSQGVLEYGETILNACDDCHQQFSPATPDI